MLPLLQQVPDAPDVVTAALAVAASLGAGDWPTRPALHSQMSGATADAGRRLASAATDAAAQDAAVRERAKYAPGRKRVASEAPSWCEKHCRLVESCRSCSCAWCGQWCRSWRYVATAEPVDGSGCSRCEAALPAPSRCEAALMAPAVALAARRLMRCGMAHRLSLQTREQLLASHVTAAQSLQRYLPPVVAGAAATAASPPAAALAQCVTGSSARHCAVQRCRTTGRLCVARRRSLARMCLCLLYTSPSPRD